MLVRHFTTLLLFILITTPSSFRAAEPPSINMVYYRETSEPLLAEAMARFELESGIRVNLVYSGINEIKSFLIKGKINNTMPDLILAPSDFVASVDDLLLSEVPKALLHPDLLSESLNTVRNNGVLYGIPIIGGNHLVLFYNKKFVTTPAKTWEELIQQADSLREKGVAPIGWNYGEMYWFAAFAGTLGGHPVTDGKITLNSDGYVNALLFYKELADSGLISARCNYDCGHKNFIAEKTAYSINGEWAFADFERTLGDNLGVALIPAIGEHPFTPMFSTVALMFPNHSLTSKKKDQLKALSLFMQDRYFQDLSFAKERFLPVNGQSYAEMVSSGNENIQMLLLQLKQAFPIPTEPAMAHAWLGMAKGFYRYLSGRMSANQAANYMQEFAERDYQKSKSEQQ